MKIVEPNFSKNQNYLFRIHETFAQKKKHSIFHKNNLKGWKVSKILRKKSSGRALACLLTCSPDTDKEIFLVSLLNTVLPFLTNQAAKFCTRSIADFIFSREFHVGIPWMDLAKIFLSYRRGVNIIQFCSISVSFGSMYFFCLKA